MQTSAEIQPQPCFLSLAFLESFGVVASFLLGHLVGGSAHNNFHGREQQYMVNISFSRRGRCVVNVILY
jgi:hypothetical protein